MSQASADLPIAGDGSPPSDEDILAALAGVAAPARTTAAYRASLLVVAVAMVLLPLAYLGLIAAVAWGMWLHATGNVAMLQGRVNRGTLFAYFTPLVTGVVGLLFMVKPLFAPRRGGCAALPLDPASEPLVFRFVERLCGLVGAPVPRRIDVDTEVNASASFRRGVASFLGSDLVLTIGLPLVEGLSLRELTGVLAHEFGHFAQGSGMRLTYVIRRVNAWFARVVYERDAWDEWLTSWTDVGGWLALVVLVVRAFVWLTRRILQLLMFAGHAISCLALRQMEYDADRHETRVAGAAAFEATLDRLVVLGLARQGALADLRRAWTSRRLADDLPALVMANVAELRAAGTASGDPAATAADLVSGIVAESRRSKTGFFDTHPSPADRIAAARTRDEAGLFRIDAPAARLFADPTGLARAATQAFYREDLGVDLSVAKIVPAATLAAESTARTSAAQAADRYFHGPLPIGAAFRLFLHDEAAPAPPAADVAAATQRLAAARDAMLAALPDIRAALAGYLAADAACDAAWAISILLDAGVATEDCPLPRTQAGREEARQLAMAATADRATAFRRLEIGCEPIRDRLAAALRLRQLPEASSPGPSDGIDGRLAAFSALREACGWIGELLDRMVNLVVVLKALKEDDPPRKALVTAFQERAGGVREVLVGLREALADAPFPYDHAAEAVSIGVHLVPTVPEPEDHAGIFSCARVALDRETELYARLSAELVERAEAIEDALGLPRFPAPITVPPRVSRSPAC